MSLCWHTFPDDPPGTKPWITWGGELECPIHHPELWEDVPESEVHVDFNSGEPVERDVVGGPPGRHWIRKKVKMDPIKQLVSPVAEVRKVVEQWVDEYGDTWAVIDGVETKVAYANPVALMKRQDGVRVEIRKALDETGIRDKSVFNPDLGYEVLPPGDDGANVLQFDMNRPHVPSTHDGDEIIPVPVVVPEKVTLWQRLKRAAKRLSRRKARR